MTSQAVLSIDCTIEPAWIQVLEVDGRTVKVLESHRAEVARCFSPALLRSLIGGSDLSSPTPNQAAQPGTDSKTQSAASEDLASTPPSAGDPSLEGHPPSSFAECGAALRKALDLIQNAYTSAVLIIPSSDYLSLNLDLPFGEAKQVAKILDLEVQDRVPFEIEEFLVEHRVLGTLAERGHDVHVSIIPKALLSGIMQVCKAAQFEPLIITTPASVLEGAFFLGPDYFKQDAAILAWRGSTVYLALRFEGRVRIDRVIEISNLGSTDGERLKALTTELRLTLLAAEARYSRPIEHLYLVGQLAEGSGFAARDLQQLLGREVEDLALSDFVIAEPGTACLASIAAPFAQDQDPPPILTNFRTREFTYSLQLSEVFAGMRRLLPMFLIALLAIFLSLTGYYYYRERQIADLQESMRTQITALLPSLTFEAGEEVAPIQAENAKLDKALESLGSGSLDKYTALDLLKEISSLMPNRPGLIIRTISIRGNRIRLQGTVPSYGDVEAIEKALQRSKTIKFRAKPPEISGAAGVVAGGAKNAQNFSFDIRVEE